MKLNWREHRYPEGGGCTVYTAMLPDGHWSAELVFPRGEFTVGDDGEDFASEDEACRWGRQLAARHAGTSAVQPASSGLR